MPRNVGWPVARRRALLDNLSRDAALIGRRQKPSTHFSARFATNCTIERVPPPEKLAQSRVLLLQDGFGHHKSRSIVRFVAQSARKLPQSPTFSHFWARESRKQGAKDCRKQASSHKTTKSGPEERTALKEGIPVAGKGMRGRSHHRLGYACLEAGRIAGAVTETTPARPGNTLSTA